MTDAAPKSSAELLATPVQFVKGVGPAKAELLQRLGLRTALDLLFFFPRDYQEVAAVTSVAQLEEDQLVSIRGTVEEVDVRNSGPGRSVLGVLVRQGHDYLRAVWFNQPFMRERFTLGQQVLLTGRVRRQGLRWEMAHPRVEEMDEQEEGPTGRIMPVYPLTEGLNQSQMRSIVRAAVQQCGDCVEEVLPEEFLDAHRLMPIGAALPEIHHPSSRESMEAARYRFIYQEFLMLQLALGLRRQRLTGDARAAALPVSTKIDARIRRLFPFELTAGQDQAIAEVSDDMGRERPMNRLLQGEVGSGKTVVAVYAILLAVAHEHQAALMAPTEVLAQQHFQTLSKFLAQARVRVGLLTGSLTAAARRALLAQVEQGEIDVVIGTQAVVQKDVQFAKLGLVVIDEQHKFGVRQRAQLRASGVDPHYLVMTATPIPRTVSMTLFGDLDVSTLRESPPGRQPVHTYWATEEQRARWWDFFRRKLREGRQGFVITPLVDESDQVAAASLEQAYEELVNGPLEAFRLDLVHGRMTSEQKEAAMQAFRQRRTQVLVATSVVEVGVDVPNATLMTIESGQRFGLAQLHQLRGRISRGDHPGYLTVFADSPNDQARQRLEALVGTTDGFELAEVDFQLRGPGDLFGTRQHGLPPLRIADLQRDEAILQRARDDSRQLLSRDPHLDAPEYAPLRARIRRRYGQAMELGDVG